MPALRCVLWTFKPRFPPFTLLLTNLHISHIRYVQGNADASANSPPSLLKQDCVHAAPCGLLGFAPEYVHLLDTGNNLYNINRMPMINCVEQSSSQRTHIGFRRPFCYVEDPGNWEITSQWPGTTATRSTSVKPQHSRRFILSRILKKGVLFGEQHMRI